MANARRVGIGVLLGLLILEAFSWWSNFRTAVDALKSRGPVGTFIVAVVTSPLVRMALIVAGLLLALRRGDVSASTSGEIPPAQEQYADVDLMALTRIFNTHTTLAGNQLAAGAIGKRVLVRGTIDNIFAVGREGFVSIEAEAGVRVMLGLVTIYLTNH